MFSGTLLPHVAIDVEAPPLSLKARPRSIRLYIEGLRFPLKHEARSLVVSSAQIIALSSIRM